MEAGLLDLPDGQDRCGGSLFGLYRYIGQSMKFGIGYNITNFSDNLIDLSFDSQGVFISLVGKT